MLRKNADTTRCIAGSRSFSAFNGAEPGDAGGCDDEALDATHKRPCMCPFSVNTNTRTLH